jgi:hypothetical protein
MTIELLLRKVQEKESSLRGILDAAVSLWRTILFKEEIASPPLR